MPTPSPVVIVFPEADATVPASPLRYVVQRSTIPVDEPNPATVALAWRDGPVLDNNPATVDLTWRDGATENVPATVDLTWRDEENAT